MNSELKILKIQLTVMALITMLSFSSCGDTTLPMPDNKILKEEYNLEKNAQEFSIWVKSFNKDTLNALVKAYVDKYKDKNLAILRFKFYDAELPVDLINKINEPMGRDSLGYAIVTFPPKGVKYTECWYWYKTGDTDMDDIRERK